MFEGLLRLGRNGDRAAVSATEPPLAPARPSIGLALGGGAARGFAHIGVLRTLAAHAIVPDVIVGSSIGAVVGGCHAAGRLDRMEAWCRELTLRGVIGFLDISLSGSGLIRGNRIALRLGEAVGGIAIEDLPLRFAAIATEIKTGHEIWLTRGSLLDAMRASYSLPGIFPPVQIGGRWMVDGALVNPVPVSTARALGARIVIAVNVNADQINRGATISDTAELADALAKDYARRRGNGMRFAERLLKRQLVRAPGRPGIPSTMVDAYNVMQDRITRSRLAGDPPDITINPRLGHIGWFDFHRACEAIDIGTEAAAQSIEATREAVAALT